MKLWISGEIQADVDDAFALLTNDIEGRVNEYLPNVPLDTKLHTWAWIGIILPESNPYYGEVKKYHRRRQVLEFRLKIDHQTFLSADGSTQRKLILDSLARSVQMMEGFGVSESDRSALIGILHQVEQDCIRP